MIETQEKLKEWLEKQPQNVCTVFATRAALRVWPIICANRFWKGEESPEKQQEITACSTGFVILSIGVFVQPTAFRKYNTPVVIAADEALLITDAIAKADPSGYATSVCFAAHSIRSMTSTYMSAADYAGSAYSASDASNSGILFALGNSYENGRKACLQDTAFSSADIFRQPLWHNASVPEGLRPEDLGDTLLIDPRFEFFARWYQGFLHGEPLDWELQRRIATEIPPETWEKGIDAVAPEIARIEAEWESGREVEEPRSPEYEPNSVAHLFDYPLSVSGNLTVAANSITVGFEQFRAETGLNETPEFLQPLEAMPASMERITAIVGAQVRSSMTEQALREEIGRLMAKVARLEAELAKAKTDLDLKSKPWFRKAAILCSAVAGLGTAVWTLSGDEIGAKKRMETLAEYWEVGKGLFNTEPVEGPAPKPQLPPATDV